MRIGSLFSGYGGLDLAVGGDLAWYSEIEPAACKVMEAHHPGVPNLGDVTKVDWSQVEPVDVITGGYPCQPFSNAGMRKGTNDERHLWPYVRDALRAIRPCYAVLENVRGHLTLGFDVVLADLADLGWSARWGVVRAADAGAPHSRARLFILAYPESSGRRTWQGFTKTEARHSQTGVGDHGRVAADCNKSSVEASDIGRSRSWNTGRRELVECCGQVAADAYKFSNGEIGWSGRMGRTFEEHGYGGDAAVGCRCQSHGDEARTWQAYAPAIIRWQHIVGRSAPAPTIRRGDRDRLNPVFVEWMMGLPEGWVTGHGLSASQELKMLGNGVVPQQARLALQLLGGVA